MARRCCSDSSPAAAPRSASGWARTPAAAGLGKATIELTLRWGFEELGVRRIEGLTAPDNELSQRAMASAGMVRQPDRDGFAVYASELD